MAEHITIILLCQFLFIYFFGIMLIERFSPTAGDGEFALEEKLSNQVISLAIISVHFLLYCGLASVFFLFRSHSSPISSVFIFISFSVLTFEKTSKSAQRFFCRYLSCKMKFFFFMVDDRQVINAVEHSYPDISWPTHLTLAGTSVRLRAKFWRLSYAMYVPPRRNGRNAMTAAYFLQPPPSRSTPKPIDPRTLRYSIPVVIFETVPSKEDFDWMKDLHDYLRLSKPAVLKNSRRRWLAPIFWFGLYASSSLDICSRFLAR